MQCLQKQKSTHTTLKVYDLWKHLIHYHHQLPHIWFILQISYRTLQNVIKLIKRNFFFCLLLFYLQSNKLMFLTYVTPWLPCFQLGMMLYFVTTPMLWLCLSPYDQYWNATAFTLQAGNIPGCGDSNFVFSILGYWFGWFVCTI